MSMKARAADAGPLPGSIRAAIPHPAGGLVVMTGFPGLETGVDGSAVFMPDQCAETLHGLRALGADTLTVLIESDELDESFLKFLEAAAKAEGLALVHFPIVDYSVPSDENAAAWAKGLVDRLDAFRAGQTRAFSCQYGAGRSGLMAALCLIEGGETPERAITLVRQHFSEAIESDEQEVWLRERG